MAFQKEARARFVVSAQVRGWGVTVSFFTGSSFRVIQRLLAAIEVAVVWQFASFGSLMGINSHERIGIE